MDHWRSTQHEIKWDKQVFSKYQHNEINFCHANDNIIDSKLQYMGAPSEMDINGGWLKVQFKKVAQGELGCSEVSEFSTRTALFATPLENAQESHMKLRHKSRDTKTLMNSSSGSRFPSLQLNSQEIVSELSGTGLGYFEFLQAFVSEYAITGNDAGRGSLGCAHRSSILDWHRAK
ncbi:hypothetical protein SELMODRAFT_416349 [Selaginella moellendorffii]|uniref:Uncharacterized protein n=1 Tax=Selaginella moellendorffii TaxID=88036 RepID=D8RZ06_SELML|nr:hypothetical protein SELMODRAFT_416349 [Selaginella moellendorffii]